jgi:hypothetical protein
VRFQLHEYRDSRLPARFWDKVSPEPNTGCWLWTASTTGARKAGALGYGRFFPTGSNGVLAHRLAYEVLVAPIPKGLELDHECNQTVCCNPDHLAVVTRTENVQRWWDTKKPRGYCTKGHVIEGKECRVCVKHRSKTTTRGHYKDWTHCKHGHELTGSNLYVTSQGRRQCVPCKRRWGLEYRARKRGAL